MTTRVLALLAASLLSCASSRAGEPSGGFFDGSGALPAQLQNLKFTPSKAARVAELAAKAAPQTGKDLYTFTAEDARAAAEVYGVLEKKTGGFAYDRNVPAKIKEQMNADLEFIRGIQGTGATPLHQGIFGPVDGPTYFGWFASRVSAVGMNSCGDAKAVACVIPYLNASKMWLTQNFVKFNHPQVARMMVVFHEARHTETRNGNWPHATCPDPFRDANGKDVRSIWTGATLAGEGACDKTPFGSYGASTIMLKNIQKFCSNCGDKVRMDAGIYADDQFGRIIDAVARRKMQDDLYK